MAVSRRRLIQVVVALVAIAALFIVWLETRPRQWPKPLSDIEVAATWLRCIDCYEGFRERLDKMPASNVDTVTRIFRIALLNGPDSLQLRRVEQDLREIWREDSLRRARRGEPIRPNSQRIAFMERYQRGFVVRWRNRGAVALALIGNPTAAAALDSARRLPLCSAADSVIYRMVQRVKPDTVSPAPVSAPGATMTGKITGGVFNHHGSPISNAQVFVVGTAFNALTGPNGNFLFNNVPASTYEIRAAFIGYRPSRQVGVTVLSGQTITQNLTLCPP